MNRRAKQLMTQLGYETKRYYVERKSGCSIWGLEVTKSGRMVAVIEHQPRGHGGDGAYHVRQRRAGAIGRLGTPLGSYKLQRLALAAVIAHDQIGLDYK